MGILDQIKQAVVNEPEAPVAPEAPIVGTVEEPVQPPVEETAPVEPVSSNEEQADHEDQLQETEEVEDRSAFNCGACAGTGLIGDPTQFGNKVCLPCGGTGKVA